MKCFVNDPKDIVDEYLDSISLIHNNISRLKSFKVALRRRTKQQMEEEKKVSLISGIEKFQKI